ncbi:MAG: Bacterial transglutaminase-like N-terminal region [Rhodobacteraceae bacterium HLUCCA09]|nr:MAG: Bacterial transglutaminase-like N-terminal region [Rhodobacteraceae bacterium HLUCCA09]
MMRALFIAALVAAGFAAPSAFGGTVGKTLAYDFIAPAGSECRAENSEVTSPRVCADVEDYPSPAGIGPTLGVSAFEFLYSNGLPSLEPSLNIDANGIGIGPDTPSAPQFGTPGDSRVAERNSVNWEAIRLEWDMPVSLTQLTVRSSPQSTAMQSIQILGANRLPITLERSFQNGVTDTDKDYFHTITFYTPLYGSTFYIRPSVTGPDIYAGYWLTGAEATVVPVPPALPLLGGAIALLAWRARAARKAAPSA